MEVPLQYGYLVVGHNKEPERIYYESSGSGRALIFIHAGFLDRRMWRDQLEFFSTRGFRAICYDVRGFGKSDSPRTEFSDYADLKTLMDHLSIRKATLVGASNGGRIALDFAISYPEMVESIVLVNSGVNGYKSSGKAEDSLWEELRLKYESRDALIKIGKFMDAVKMQVDIWGTALSEQAAERLLEIAMDNYRVLKRPHSKFQKSPIPTAFERLGEIKVPTLIIAGLKDFEGSQVELRRIHSMIHGGKLVTMKDAGHIANMSQPDEFNRILLEFLSGK